MGRRQCSWLPMIRNGSPEKRFSFRAIYVRLYRQTVQQQEKGNEDMKTKLFSVVLVASAVTIAQANPGDIPAAKGTVNRGAVARSAPAVHAPMRPGGVSSFRSTPMRSYGSRPFYSGQRHSSFGMRSSPSSVYRRPFNSSRGSFMRSGHTR